MNRILVLGCCGSGKSTFSRRLNKILNIELIHLDQYYWKSNWVESNEKDWSNKVQELVERSEWIMDGNYGGTINIRIEKADTIIYLDYPTSICLWRVIKRIIKFHGKSRPDMPKGCNERFDYDFLKYVTTFNMLKRDSLMSKLELFKNEKRIEILKSEKELSGFLSKLKKRK